MDIQLDSTSLQPLNIVYKTHIPVSKGTVLHGYAKLKPAPIPEHTRDLIVTVLPIPVPCLSSRKQKQSTRVTENADPLLPKNKKTKKNSEFANKPKPNTMPR